MEYGPPVAVPRPVVSGPMLELGEVAREFLEEVRRRGLVAGSLFGVRQAFRWLPAWRLQARVLLATRGLEVDEFGFDPKFYALAEPVLEYLYSRYWRVEADGLNNVPRQGRAILVANHAGVLPFDAAMVAYAVRRDHLAHRLVRPLLEDFVFHAPFLGPLVNRLGAVRASQENGRRLLEQGQLVLVFPEGIQGSGKPFSRRYRLQRFGRGGFVRLALATGSPVIPVAVVGSEEIYPLVGRVRWLARSVGLPFFPVTPLFPWLGPLGLLPLPVKWLVRFGQPVDLPGDYGPEAASNRLLVHRLGELVRSRVQDMVEELRRERRSLLA